MVVHHTDCGLAHHSDEEISEILSVYVCSFLLRRNIIELLNQVMVANRVS